MNEILERVLEGGIPTREEACELLDSKAVLLDDLIVTAGNITRQYHGNTLETCAIYAAKVGKCSGDCAFCAQSAHHESGVSLVRPQDIDPDSLLNYARGLEKKGLDRFSLVTSGERLTEAEFTYITDLIQTLHDETNLKLCASLGSLDSNRADKLVESGVSRYHHNIETARSFFSSICSTHSYEEKLATIRVAREAGMEVCSGGILSMGESKEQRVEMAFALRELDVDSIPINILNPIQGTRLEAQAIMGVDEILRTIAVFRLIMPEKTIRFAGGREEAMGKKEYLGYSAGINALLVGNYLTTQGRVWEQEIQNLKALGYARGRE